MLLKTKSEEDPSVKPNVEYQIIMDWDGSNPDDVDLWYSDPKGRIVSFNRREGGKGSLASLAHDDLGSMNDEYEDGTVVEANQEIISLRGIIDEGEHIVNAHMYSKRSKPPTEVSIKLVKIKPYKEIIKETKTLIDNGDQETFFRFSLDKNGKVVDINHLAANLVYR